ncbi:hypothetical protein PM082_009237 [Marasmius tenuissimus]|nr:hypothetical protein PM082_009237 [Marasmius tenuissimus]
MQKCVELSRLNRATGRIKSLKFRRQTPGDPNGFITLRGGCFDPSHPGFGSARNIFPKFIDSNLTVNALPFSLLPTHDIVPPHVNFFVEPWTERVRRTISSPDYDPNAPELLPVKLQNEHPEQRRLPISVRFIIPIKTTSKKKVVRGRITNRLRTAIALATVKGAEVKEVDGKETVVMNEEKGTKMLKEGVRSGWMYTFIPSLEVYLMPHAKLIPLVEKALSTVSNGIVDLERTWAKKALREVTAPAKVQQAQATRPSKQASRSLIDTVLDVVEANDDYSPLQRMQNELPDGLVTDEVTLSAGVRASSEPPAETQRSSSYDTPQLDLGPILPPLNTMDSSLWSSNESTKSWRSLVEEDGLEERLGVKGRPESRPDDFLGEEIDEDHSLASRIRFGSSSTSTIPSLSVSLSSPASSASSRSHRSNDSRRRQHRQPIATQSSSATLPQSEGSATQRIFDFHPIIGKVPQSRIPNAMRVRRREVKKPS